MKALSQPKRIGLFALAPLIVTGLLLGEVIADDLAAPWGFAKPDWSIGIYTGTSPFDLKPATRAHNPVITAKDITDVRARYVADPFIVREGHVWYMFLEVDNVRTKQGDIGLAVSDDGLAWKYKGIVLDEPFHLSYPQVFKWDGRYYMIPESKQAHSVRLYEAVRFPTEWRFAATLLKIPGVDSSIIRWQDKWWLFVCGKFVRSYSLRLFYADSLKGPWKEHPKSPIVEGDPSKSRPGGRMLIFDGHPIRFAQDDHPEYGKRVRAFRIKKLTVEDYEEEELPESPVLKASGAGWNSAGMHQIDAHRLGDGRWLAAVDGHTWFPLKLIGGNHRISRARTAGR